MEFIRLEICTLFTLSHFQTPHSNTLTQTPKSVTLNPSECNKTHPHPQTLSSFLTIGFRWSPHPYLQHPFCPYQRKFRFFQVWRYVFSFVCSFIENWEMKNNLWCGKGTFSYKNLSFLNNYSIWVSFFFPLQNLTFFGLFCEIVAFDMRNLHWN